MRETQYQNSILIPNIKQRLPGSFILLNDPKRIQGIPDILVLWQDRWAMLETKRSANEDPEPNQEYYVDMFNEMSFSTFIFPENEDEVLSALQSAFGVKG
jgi:hypothetical protein